VVEEAGVPGENRRLFQYTQQHTRLYREQQWTQHLLS
jgi:hypothetical protein